MNKIRIIILSVGMLIITPYTHAADFSYNYADVNFGQYSPKTGSAGSGYNFAGSYGMGESFNFMGSYDSATLSGVATTDLTVGVGYHMSVGDTADLTADINYRTISAGGQTWNGYTATVGMRYMATTKLELRTAFGQTSVSGVTNASGTIYNLGAIYSISDKMGVNVSYQNDAAVPWSIIKAGVRFNL